MFECDYHLYEVIMTACTPKEELEWKSRLADAPRERESPKESTEFDWLSLDIKPLGTVFGKPGE